MCSNHQSKDSAYDYYANDGWISFQECSPGTAICGIQSRWESWSSSWTSDNTSLNDLKIYCCRICDEDDARYVDSSTKECKECHYTCKKCTGPAQNQCTSCYFSVTPSSGTCSDPSSD